MHACKHPASEGDTLRPAKRCTFCCHAPVRNDCNCTWRTWAAVRCHIGEGDDQCRNAARYYREAAGGRTKGRCNLHHAEYERERTAGKNEAKTSKPISKTRKSKTKAKTQTGAKPKVVKAGRPPLKVRCRSLFV